MSVILVIVEIEEIRSEIHSPKCVVREGTPSTMNLHGSVCSRKKIVDLLDVVCELNGVPEDVHPGLSIVCDFRWFGVIAWISDNHNLFSS